MPVVDRPRRSALYMPASNARALEKAKGLVADMLIFDLEDAVAPDAKNAARDAAVDAVDSGAYGQRELLIRANGLDTSWAVGDLQAIAKSKSNGVLVPKVSSVDDVTQVDAILTAAGAPADFPIWAMMETPRGILSADSIAQASPRLAGMCIGTADLSKELQCVHPADRAPMVVSLQLVILAARANGLVVLDGVHVELNDAEGFEAACRQGRDLGFDGKTLIHPNQIDGANAAYAPSPEDIEYAHRLIAAYQEAEAKGAGVTTLDGRLIEVLHVAEAKRLLAKADMISALSQNAVA
ncbi:MAG: CoA ester lyase [Rhodospirillaceae bacterium]|jgi:citrate lyase subunit beta / citryl-CoA lyase|nr:CoA ester lyase [Rhodospirillaceae bacterium]MBT5567056.1 CoA ester lyase [Rhodospirillaceae bacterium]MBT6089551.1 CoA ester lyase [Rhodospirillaceae bacterium]MBT6960495.1 CoA ester lyase [Rhodospirillaceae bacterium]MBT7450997.1 CoA ester lyase [Rhodospirillaceae bacterium]